MMKKIAIPTDGELINDHFGHCQYYTIFSINKKNQIEDTQIMAAPEGCGCKSDIANILVKMDVDIMLAGNIGQGAIEKIGYAGLKVYRGYSGRVTDVVNSYLGGNLGNDNTCMNHHHHNN